MTTQEAKKALNNIVECWTYRPEEREAAIMAIEALERRVVATPKIKRGNYYCPTCNACFVGVTDGYIMNYNAHSNEWDEIESPGLHGTTPYCGNCGQALDWKPSHGAD